jgi:hypothetical protein
MEQKYRYRKQAGALQEAALPAPRATAPPARMATASMATASLEAPIDSYASAHDTAVFAVRDLQRVAAEARRMGAPAITGTSSLEPHQRARSGMFFYTIEENQRVVVVRSDGTIEIAEGPRKMWRWGKRFRPMEHHIAHPGEFLMVRYRDGRQEHVRGPAHVWLDPRQHLGIGKEEIFQISDREAVVVYSKDAETGRVGRRIVHGPADFMPEPGEWLHTFSWHGSRPDADGSYRKVPNAMVFQKLWLLPDQMYHDVPEVRTADGAVLTIRLMIFFELLDIEKMLVTTHDPIGDFVNAATADVVEFLSKHDFETFKASIEKLNDLDTYEQLTSRAEQCGYRIGKVVYRGYGAPEALQQMHEQALESRTRLRLEKDTETQAQELEDLKLDRRLTRSAKERTEQSASQAEELLLAARREQAALENLRARRELERAQQRLDAEAALEREAAQHQARAAWLARLRDMQVDLTAYLTQDRSDQVIELRGPADHAMHVHLDGQRGGDERSGSRVPR